LAKFLGMRIRQLIHLAGVKMQNIERMSKPNSVVMLGASGAVGLATLACLLEMAEVERITLLVRRPISDLQDRRVTQHVVDVFNPETYRAFVDGHRAAICTFGVGEPSKVSPEEFTRVDHDAVLNFAKTCRAGGVQHFELLGSVAADPKSGNFYLRGKGQLRVAIAALGFARFSIFQPSMILTPQNRYGLSQGIMLVVWPWLSHLLVGGLKKYRGIKVTELGSAIAKNVQSQSTGNETLHWPEIAELSRRAT
jgi:uncharacterized protein YbjT (DUF2867 family)